MVLLVVAGALLNLGFDLGMLGGGGGEILHFGKSSLCRAGVDWIGRYELGV